MEHRSVISFYPSFYNDIGLNKTPLNKLFLTLPLFDKYFVVNNIYQIFTCHLQLINAISLHYCRRINKTF